MINWRVMNICFALVAVLVIAGPGWSGEDTLKGLLSEARANAVYQTPSAAELKAARELFEKLFSGVESDRMKSWWEELGFDFRPLTLGKKGFYVILEKPSRRIGRGFFIFPQQPLGPWTLQIPHGFKDLNTDDIGLLFMAEGDFSGAAFNTVPRYVKIGGKKLKTDMGDLLETFFISFTEALVSSRPDAHIIQIHGFSRSKRKTLAGLEAQIIVSNGTDFAPFWLKKFDGCLQAHWGDGVKMYPNEVMELGGTQNVVGRVMRRMGSDRFVHFELSSKIRLELRKHSSQRKRMMECIREALD